MKLNHWSLSNGVRCVITEMEHSTLTSINFWCKGGSIYESKNEEGMAHFLEHMIFKGSEKLVEGEFDNKIESLGGSSNAATGLDDVHFYILIPPQNLEEALKLLLDLLMFPQIKENAFEVEKQVVLEEIAQSHDQPDEIIYMKLFKECYSPHRYSKPILGYKQTVERIEPRQMKSFHENQYIGGNCTLSIAGKIPEEIYLIIENSKIKQLKSSIGKVNKQSKVKFNKGYTKERIPRLEGGRILKAWELPPAKNQLLILGVEIASTLLCEGRISPMVKRLREELRIVESIEMDLQILEEGGLILLDVCCPIGNLKNAEREINNILYDSIEKPFTNKDIDRAKKIVSNNLYYGVEVSSQVAAISGNHTLWGRNQAILEPIKNIPYWTAERLNEVVFPLLNPKDSYTLIAEPK